MLHCFIVPISTYFIRRFCHARFDFSNSPEKAKVSECTYTVFRTNAPFTSPDQPILILDTKEKAFPHHPCGIFTNPSKRTSFEFKNEEETFIADILQIDARLSAF